MSFAHFVINNTIFEQHVKRFERLLSVGSFGVLQVEFPINVTFFGPLNFFFKSVVTIGKLEHNKMLTLELNSKIINDKQKLILSEIQSYVNVMTNYWLMRLIKLRLVDFAHIVNGLCSI